MARKATRRNTPPSLTRLTPRPETPPTEERPVPTPLSVSQPRGRTLEQEYAHVRGDLRRILTLAALILIGMFALKAAGI